MRLTTLLLAQLLLTATAALGGSRVYIVLVDALDASFVSEQLTPHLWQLATAPDARGAFYPHAQAIMPSVTNPNHAAVMTGTYAEAHGIVGNLLWNRTSGTPTRSEGADLEVETLYTVVEKERPSLTTAGVFGKARLVSLFGNVPGRQHRPDVLWGDPESEEEPIDPRAGFASDERTMNEALRVITERDPDLLFVALPDVDRTAHLFGPASNQARRAVLEADRQLGRLVDLTRRLGIWNHLVLMVTADHGMESVEPDPSRRYPIVLFGRELARAGLTDVWPLTSGGIEYVALAGKAPTALDHVQAERLRAVRALALAQPEIAEAWYRLPNPADGGDANMLARVHPDWRLAHPLAGELVLVAAPNYFFADPFSPHLGGLAGEHGGPGQRAIAILVTGGDPRLRPAARGETNDRTAANPDLGQTAAWVLGVRPPRFVSGGAVEERLRGRILREAFE
ncbi:MAG TPA: ectonucleotide pyrophosphatase/phosphodiesterase [Candidatus Binatus sp.]|nr:ectonucleotide pyrophosphatase/phosphodiesterase [Candidatus Binatus sp.]